MIPRVKSKEEFLKRTVEERKARDSQRACTSAARKIQRYFRNAIGKKQALQNLRNDIDSTLTASKTASLAATELFHAGQKLLFIFKKEEDYERFLVFCEAVLSSMERNEVKAWYVTLALNRKHAVAWIKQVKRLLNLSCQIIKCAKPGFPKDDRTINLLLGLMVMMSDYTLWKFTAKAGNAMKPTLCQLCASFVDHLMDKNFFPTMNELLIKGLCCIEPKLSKHSLPAAMGIRAMALKQFPRDLILLFVHHVLSVPASMLHLQNLAPETMQQLNKLGFLSRIVEVLLTLRSSFSCLDLNPLLAIMSNLLYLGSLEVEVLSNPPKREYFVVVILNLISGCETQAVETQSNTSFWHPLIGWCKGNMDSRLLESFAHVKKQLQCLWQKTFVDIIFSPFLIHTSVAPNEKGKSKFSLSKGSAQISKSSKEHASQVCEMYLQILTVVVQLSSDVLVGLCCNRILLCRMYEYLREATSLQVKAFVGGHSPHGSVLALFCQIMQYLLGVLDDQELFEEQQYFSVKDLTEMSLFLNHLEFHATWEQQASIPTHALTLLTMLYNRDSKHSFCGEGHWLIKELKINSFVNELKIMKPRALAILSKVPHIIPHRKRVEIFHRHIDEEKQKLGISRDVRCPATYITIHRSRILEDGYTQLSLLSTAALKRTIRVKFVNEQGLDEAGIDETGVFKEYLEETIKIAFDPRLSLFKSNTVGHLFPSSSSHIHENHLALFEFVGKMLGKALFEGIIIDVPFAPFFLSQMLHQHHATFYSYFDELASMDQEMYKSLNFVKHYDGDISDLCLTFSWDEEFMGKVVTHELIPGGCGIPLTVNNRINYVHRMALFRMRTQIKKQISAFMRGFHSIISLPLIQMFSPHELQKLISGDQVDLDVDDLRTHTEYYGGYHNHHKVISWFWDILKKDFAAEEKGKLLKFVTSCSKPPVLGFEHLHPRFSIRYVQVSDEMDAGDTFSSVVKGFFSIRQERHKDRLPTASTCFNLLKLPNYNKKSVLREKLRYAINANAGFELS